MAGKLTIGNHAVETRGHAFRVFSRVIANGYFQSGLTRTFQVPTSSQFILARGRRRVGIGRDQRDLVVDRQARAASTRGGSADSVLD